MTESDGYGYDRDGWPECALQPSARFIGQNDISRQRRWRELIFALEEHGQRTPDKEGHNHNGCDLHNPQGSRTRFFDSFDIAPPEIDSDDDAEKSGETVCIEMDAAMRKREYIVQKAHQILSGTDATDRSGQYVVEYQGRNREARDKRAHAVADHDIHAAANEHAAAFRINGTHGKAEDHYAENVPGSRLADRLFRDAAGIEH